MVRVASYTVMSYWRDLMRKPTILRLSGEVNNGNGDGETSELWQTLADDKALDLEAWQDAKWWLLGCSRALVKIAYKKVDGQVLNNREHQCLW